MRNDGWVAGAAALVVLSGLTGALLALAIRPVYLPPIEPAAGPLLPAATSQHDARPLLCMSVDVICSSPQLPVGYPCSCLHPLRGAVGGRVTALDDADEALAARPGGDRRLDPEDVFGP